MSQSSTEEEAGAVELHLTDGTVIRGAEVLSEGRTFAALDCEDSEVKLADTTVIRANEKLYRTVTIATGSGKQHHQITPEQEEAVIQNAAKEQGNVKVSFTRWAQMVKKGEYPANATPQERALFGECLLSNAVVLRRQLQKRERDAESRRRRAQEARESKKLRLSPPPERQASPPVEASCASIEITIRGNAAEVMSAINALSSKRSLSR